MVLRKMIGTSSMVGVVFLIAVSGRVCAQGEAALGVDTSAGSSTDWKGELSSDRQQLNEQWQDISENAQAARSEEKDLLEQIKEAKASGDFEIAKQLRDQLHARHQENVARKQQDIQELKGLRDEFKQDVQSARSEGAGEAGSFKARPKPSPEVGDRLENIRDHREDFKDRREDFRDRREDFRDRKEDVRDHGEDIRDRREDIRDRREDVWDRRHDGGPLDRLEDRRDRQEDVRDRREDVRDRREDRGDRRENRFDRREDVRDRAENRQDRRENIGDHGQHKGYKQGIKDHGAGVGAGRGQGGKQRSGPGAAVGGRRGGGSGAHHGGGSSGGRQGGGGKHR